MQPWTPGEVIRPEAGVRMVLAPNPSPMTHWGTNTYIIGEGAVAVIDPGPALPEHLTAILAALAPGERVSHILVTHPHLDHSPLARPLAEATGAPVLGFGPAGTGLSPRMAGITGLGGGEGIDTGFTPDVQLADGDFIPGGDWQLEVLHTPGHMAGHLAFALDGLLFTGDHVMGWAPSLVSPPEGDMTDYMASLDRLAARPWRRFLSAHGLPVETPAARLSELTTHRRARETAILEALTQGPAGLDALTARVYSDVSPALQPAARRNLLAHLIDLSNRKQITADRPTLHSATFTRS
ncbi:hydroxyacylglutathione hydrolase [Gemmobacter caeni]|uniref:Hydroxyacylglutathione hydrolase n=1 Tax=Gemmobacter caeni TaxID=589035 RepID=A0A2T6ARG4_9RHOB|nr:MBL fold metallo-hydrolase [Gemmobacter caeni]PTX46419.1 hydroxyacylglutathione hydrolase [Gemmobacter caeni]TWI95251.1 hydroxyacylglutathione hydrolase [Gemmobacter caeni]